MAITEVKVDGFEYGAVASLTAGAGLFNAVTNGAIDTTNERTALGACCLKVTPTNAASGSAQQNILTASPRQVVLSGWVKIDTMPGAGAWVNVLEIWAGSGKRVIVQMGDGGKFRIQGDLADTPTSGTVSTLTNYVAGTYYNLQVQCISPSTVLETVNWSLNGVAQTGLSLTVTAQRSYASVRFGHDSTTKPASTYNIYWDDVIWGATTATTAEALWGQCDVEMIVPTADGTVAAGQHNVGTNAYQYSDNNGTNVTAITNTTTVTWSRVDEWPDVPTANAADDYVELTADSPVATSYVQWRCGNPVGSGGPLGVSCYVALEAAATTANVATLQLMEDDTAHATAVYTGTVGSTSVIYKYGGFVAKPSTGAWTDTAADAIGFRYTGTDGNPDHRVKAIMAQVAFPSSTTSNYTDAATPATVTAITTTELFAVVEAATPNGVTAVSATEIAAYVESATIAGKTTPSGSDVFTGAGTNYTDSATVAGVTTVYPYKYPTVYETFNIANEDPITTNWDGPTIINRGPLAIASNQLAPGTTVVFSTRQSYYDLLTFLEPDVTMEIAAIPNTTGDEIDILLGIINPNTTGITQFYNAGLVKGAVTDTYQITRISANNGTVTGTTLASGNCTFNMAPGQAIRATLTGTGANRTITLYHIDAKGVSTQLATVTDVSTPAALQNSYGFVGAEIDRQGGVSRVDNFRVFDINVQQTDIAQYVESATVSSVTTPSGSDVYTSAGTVYTDAATVSGITSLSATETRQSVESATVANVTTPSSTDLAAYVDATTCATVTSVTSTDVAAYVDASTTAGVTTPSSAEVHEIPDSSTISSKTSLTSTEVAAYVETGTIASTTGPSATDAYAGIDTSTILSSTLPSSADVAGYVDTSIIASISVPSSVDVAAYVDSSTTSSKTTPSSIDLHEIPDTATISSITFITSTEVATYVDSATTSGTTTPSSTETHEIPDTGTIAGKTTVISNDLASYLDAGSPSGQTSVSSSDLYASTDSGTIAGVTSLSSVELKESLDSSTITGTTSLTSVDIYAAIDVSTISTVTTPQAVETTQTVDAATPNSVTTPSSAELHEIPDSSTVSGITVITTSDVAAYVDSSTLVGATSVQSTEQRTGTDTGTVASTTTVIGSDIALYVDADTPTSGTSVNSTDAYAVSESATIATVSSLTSSDIYNSVDSNTIGSSTSITYTDFATYIEQGITAGTTTVTSSELHEIPDTATVAGTTSLSSVDIAAYVDSSSIPATTSITSVETSPGDTSTISTVTAISYTEFASYVESNTLATTTSLSSSDLLAALESNTLATTTSITYTENAQYVNSSLVTSTTTISSVEAYTPSPQHARPIADVTTGGWLPSDGVSPLYSLINETVADSSTYIYATAV